MSLALLMLLVSPAAYGAVPATKSSPVRPELPETVEELKTYVLSAVVNDMFAMDAMENTLKAWQALQI